LPVPRKNGVVQSAWPAPDLFFQRSGIRLGGYLS
jgi:hypothetical protein